LLDNDAYSVVSHLLWSYRHARWMGCLQERSLDLDERIDAEQVCLSSAPRLAGLMTRAMSAQMYATHRHTRLPCAVCMSSLNPIIGCTLLDTSQTTLPVPCYVLYTSRNVCCRLHVIRVTMHYRLRAVCSPHGLTNTCARQASGSVSRCHSERTVHAAE